jgi:SAM-dependent methyltransferase
MPGARNRRDDPLSRIEFEGWCPVCEAEVRFASADEWYRDNLKCGSCGSLPRERALAVVLDMSYPSWYRMALHECGPIERGISRKLADMAALYGSYIATDFDPTLLKGSTLRGDVRNENLEDQTFPDECFDLVVSLDVMEHVNKPDRAVREVWRTLKQGGAYVFTTPTWSDQPVSRRRAEYLPGGEIRHLAEPEYHGGSSGERSLVTFTYGLDLPQLITDWAPFDVAAFKFADQTRGILGDMTDVYLCRKR